MPTEPIDIYLSRNIESEKLEKVLNHLSDLIEETVNFSTHVFDWCSENVTGKDEKIPIIMSYRQVLELIDAVSILVRNSCIDPCKILLRAMFESTLAIEYILEKKMNQRGMDFMVCYYHDELKFYRRWDPDDSMCKEFRLKLESDKILKNWQILEFPNVGDEIEKRKKIFQLPIYHESELEYQRVKKQLKGTPKWFSLHNGPQNIQELAEYLERGGLYQILYRHWSPVVHGTDLIRGKISLNESGNVGVHPIRLPTNAEEIAKHTVNFALLNMRNYNRYFCPERQHKIDKWYQDNIHGTFMELITKNAIKVEFI